MSPAAEPGLAADGDPLADGGTEGDSIVHPMRGRIDLTISATGPLEPNTAVTLTIGGVAREAIDSGEVVLTLPTRALMDHAGAGSSLDLPAVASWDLPPMAEGDTWSGSHTVPGEAAGWYSVLANAYTHGPDGGPWLFDDVLREAWMYFDETAGRLTRILEDSVAPLAGPVAGWPTGPLARNPDYPRLHPDSVYLHVVYSASQREGLRPAVAAQVEAELREDGGVGHRDLGSATVPEDGIVAFRCPEKGWSIGGYAHARDTDLVQGRKEIAYWGARVQNCGKLLELEVLAHRYYPWRLLNLAADTLTRHFKHWRKRIDWKLHFDNPRERSSYYNRFPFVDKITLAWLAAERPRFRWTVAHEYGHALHHKALGGIWKRSPNCGSEDRGYPPRPTSYQCALKEGFADYAGTVGSVTADDPDGYYGECLEYLGTPNAPGWPPWCRDIQHERKPEIEWWVAALFNDLIDANDNYEGIDDYYMNDKTHYSGYYVASVFRSCESKRGSWPDHWKGRSRVYDFVWCLEEYVHKPTHERVFPDEPVPDTAKHKAKRPKEWSWSDIRSTWLRNLAEEGK